jgi:hypothetical protein
MSAQNVRVQQSTHTDLYPGELHLDLAREIHSEYPRSRSADMMAHPLSSFQTRHRMARANSHVKDVGYPGHVEYFGHPHNHFPG